MAALLSCSRFGQPRKQSRTVQAENKRRDPENTSDLRSSGTLWSVGAKPGGTQSREATLRKAEGLRGPAVPRLQDYDELPLRTPLMLRVKSIFLAKEYASVKMRLLRFRIEFCGSLLVQWSPPLDGGAAVVTVPDADRNSTSGDEGGLLF